MSLPRYATLRTLLKVGEGFLACVVPPVLGIVPETALDSLY